MTIAPAAFPERPPGLGHGSTTASIWPPPRSTTPPRRSNGPSTRPWTASVPASRARSALLERGVMPALDAMEFLAKGPFESDGAAREVRPLARSRTAGSSRASRRSSTTPASILEAMKGALGQMIAAVPRKALAALDELSPQLPHPRSDTSKELHRYLEQGPRPPSRPLVGRAEEARLDLALAVAHRGRPTFSSMWAEHEGPLDRRPRACRSAARSMTNLKITQDMNSDLRRGLRLVLHRLCPDRRRSSAASSASAPALSPELWPGRRSRARSARAS